VVLDAYHGLHVRGSGGWLSWNLRHATCIFLVDEGHKIQVRSNIQKRVQIAKRKVFRAFILPLWIGWFRWGNRVLSRLANRFRPRLHGSPPHFHTLDEFRKWWTAHTRWKSDPLGGVADITASLEHALWQWEHKGIFEDDCDGLAFVGAQCLRPLSDHNRCYVVTVVLDPFEFPSLKEGIQMGAHVMCFFSHLGRWRVLSNTDVFPGEWDTFEDALLHNPYTAGHTILWYRVQEIS